MAEGRAVKKSSSKNKPGAGESRLTQLLVLLLLGICCFASFYLYNGTTKLVQGSYSSLPDASAIQIDTTTQTESQEVKETENAVSSLGKASSQVMQSAMLAEVSGKQPFGTASSLASAQAAANLAAAGVEQIEEPQPPTVTVVAVMIKGSDKVAMIDVEGQEGGLVVREGSKFSDGSARITKINPEGVKFTWMKKSYEAAMPR